jgi:hypothetical protein
MSEDISKVLHEIRDLLASREQQYKEHLANCERSYKEQLDASRRQAMINQPFQWGALFVVNLLCRFDGAQMVAVAGFCGRPRGVR